MPGYQQQNTKMGEVILPIPLWSLFLKSHYEVTHTDIEQPESSLPSYRHQGKAVHWGPTYTTTRGNKIHYQ